MGDLYTEFMPTHLEKYLSRTNLLIDLVQFIAGIHNVVDSIKFYISTKAKNFFVEKYQLSFSNCLAAIFIVH